MAPTLTYEQLLGLKPCKESLDRVCALMGGASTWNGNPVTAQQAREAGATLDDIVWAAATLAGTDRDVERRVRLWMADCAAHVLHLFENERPTDARVRDCIGAARRFALREIDTAAWDVAWAAAWDAAWAATCAAARAAARAAAWGSTREAHRFASRAAAWGVTRAVTRAVPWHAAWTAAWNAAWVLEETWQFDRLIARLSDEEPEDWPLPDLAVGRGDELG
jgi:hypothetical protein